MISALKKELVTGMSTQTRPERVRPKDEGSRRRRWIHGATMFLAAAMLAFLAALLKAYMGGEFNSVESLQKYIAKCGPLGPLALTLFQALQVVIPVLPGFFGCAAGAVMFGPAVGFLCNYIGISAGSIIAFLLAKKFGRPLVEDLFHGGKYGKWSAWAARSKSYTAFLFMAMVLPLFPDDFFCYMTGLSQMKARRFVWIILLGKPWCILAYSLGFSLIK